MAHATGGALAKLDADMFDKIKELLTLWYHNPEMGHIWIASDSDEERSVIMVSVLYSFSTLV